MNLRDIALISLRRQKGKKSFVLVAMALGCATVISLFIFTETQRRTIENQFDEYGANIVVLPKSDNLGLSYGGVSINGVVANLQEIRLSDIEKIWQIPNRDNIRAVSAKLLGAVQVKNGHLQAQALLVGVSFEEELRIKPWWEIDGDIPSESGEIIVGSEAAEKLQIRVGDIVIIEDNELMVSALLRPTGSQDDSIIFADFSLVSSLLGKEGVVSLAEVSALCSDCPIELITDQLSSALPNANVREIKQVMKQKMQAVQQFGRFVFTVTLVIVAIGGVLIFTSMMGSVTERKNEIGVFRAMGFKRVHIAIIILTEALLLSLIAGVVGTVAGLLISYGALPYLLSISRETLAIDLRIAGISLPAMVFVAMVAAVYPALRASRVDPVMAINSL
jgi:putative ABC transport system permease protein